MEESKADKIRRLWKQTKQVHLSYSEIARQAKTNKGYVWKVVKRIKTVPGADLSDSDPFRY